MKSLLSVNSYHYARGGADRVYLDHGELFQARGWRNTYFAMHHPLNIPCCDSEYFAEYIDYSAPGGIIEKAVHAGRIIYSFEAQRKLASLLDSRSIDVAHVHNIYHHQSPSVLIELKRRNIPAVLTAHDLKIACPNKMMMNYTGVCERCKGGKVWNAALFRCIKDRYAPSVLVAVESAVHKALGLYEAYLDKIIVPSRFYREKLIEWGWNPDQIVHIPNFVPQQAAAPAAGPGDYLLYFGRLAPEKGVMTLVRAASRSGIRVLIAGTGPEEGRLRAEAERIGAPVEFVGFLTGEALRELVDGCRAVVLPSEWYENGPMSVIEAFGRGKPLIGARIGGIPELIVQDETGWLFEPGDAEGLASTLSVVAGLPSSRLVEMGERTCSIVTENYTPSMYFERMTRLYGSIGR